MSYLKSPLLNNGAFFVDVYLEEKTKGKRVRGARSSTAIEKVCI